MKDSTQLLDNMTTRNVAEFTANQQTTPEQASHVKSDAPVDGNALELSVLDFANYKFHELTSERTTSRSESSTTLTSVECCHGDANEINPDPEVNTQPILDTADLSNQDGHIRNGHCRQNKTRVLEKAEIARIPQTHLAIGLLVLCCFNLPLGLVALYLSLRSAAAYRDGDRLKGLLYARASILFSLTGIMLTMMAVGSIVVYIAANKHSGDKKTGNRFSSSSFGF